VFRHTLPSRQKVYSLNLDSDLFSDHDLKLELAGDSTLKTLDLQTTVKVDEALKEIGKQAKSVS
jgi:hypothetical protein